MVDEVTSVMNPLLDFILSLVGDGVDALANILDILAGDVKHRLGDVVWGCECNGDEGEEGQECGCSSVQRQHLGALRQSPADSGTH